MVHRDPETGLFVSDDHSVDRYSDFEHQHVHSSYDVDAADLPGAFPIQESDIRVVDLDDLLDRNERADLIMLEIHGIQASVPGTTTTEAALRAAIEIGIGAGDRMILAEDRDDSTDTGSSGVVDRNLWESDSPDTLYFAEWISEGSFGDTANGVGAGADAPVLEDETHFPRDYGTCPEFDERDEITESIVLDEVGGAGIDDSLIELNVSYSLVFAIEELEPRR
jgi:hypothetical protein